MAEAASPVRAILWQVASGLLFVGMTAVVKHAGQGVPAAQSAFLRFALGLPFVLPWIPALRRIVWTPRLAGLVAARGGLHTVAVLLWFFALTNIPLAEVTAINYLSPVCVMLGAALFLGEPLRARRMLAVAIAILGALVILRPGFRAVEPGHLAMLGMAGFMGSAYLVTKRLSAELSAGVIVALLSVSVTIFLLPFAALAWRPVGLDVVGWLFLSACFATAAHYCMTRAFAAAPLGVTQPLAFLQLVWSAALGALAFDEAVDPLVVAGALAILTAIFWSSLAEARDRRSAGPPVVAE